MDNNDKIRQAKKLLREAGVQFAIWSNREIFNAIDDNLFAGGTYNDIEVTAEIYAEITAELKSMDEWKTLGKDVQDDSTQLHEMADMAIYTVLEPKLEDMRNEKRARALLEVFDYIVDEGVRDYYKLYQIAHDGLDGMPFFTPERLLGDALEQAILYLKDVVSSEVFEELAELDGLRNAKEILVKLPLQS